MKRTFWLLLVAVLVSLYALSQLLENPPEHKDKQIRIYSSDEPQSGESAANGKTINMQEIETRIRSEQLAVPLRNPERLSGAPVQSSAPFNQENSIENEKVLPLGQAVKPSAQDGLPEGEDEELPDDTVSDESEEEGASPDENPTEESLTEDELPDSEDEETPDDTVSDESEEEGASPDENPTEESLTEDELPEGEDEELPDDTVSDEPEEEEPLPE